MKKGFGGVYKGGKKKAAKGGKAGKKMPFAAAVSHAKKGCK